MQFHNLTEVDYRYRYRYLLTFLWLESRINLMSKQVQKTTNKQ